MRAKGIDEGENDENKDGDIFNNEAMENPWFEEVEASSNFVKIAAKNVQSENGQTQMRETITAECQKINGRVFNGQFQ